VSEVSQKRQLGREKIEAELKRWNLEIRNETGSSIRAIAILDE